MNVLALFAADDHTGTEKADAGHDALHDTAHVAFAVPHGDDDLRRGEAHQCQRPHTGRLAMQIAVQPERCARERGHSEPEGDLGGVQRLSLFHFGRILMKACRLHSATSLSF